MELTYSPNPKTVASRRWALNHPGAKAAYAKKWRQKPGTKAKTKAYAASWYVAHRDYVRKYQRIYKEMTKAFKAGNAVLGEKLKADLIIHKQSLENRKGIGGTPVFV